MIGSGGDGSPVPSNTSGKSQTYSFTLDAFGKTEEVKVGSRVLASYEYAANNGLLESQTYENGHKVTFTYDNLGRTKTVTWSNDPEHPEVPAYSRTLTYAYTGQGQLHSVTESGVSNPATYLYHYDTLGNLVGMEKREGTSLVLRTYASYNQHNQLASSGWQIGSDSFSQTYTYDPQDGNLSTMTLPGGQTVTFTYDTLRRLSAINNGVLTRQYIYEDISTGEGTPTQTTSRVTKVSYPSLPSRMNYSYTYDESGKIVSMSFGKRTNTYVYDSQNQLTRENNDRLQYTQTWTYDNAGNILSTSKYAYTTGDLGEPTSTVTYGYGNADWADLLTSYDGNTIEYDNIGNPTSVKDSSGNVLKSYTWTEGRQLTSYTTNGVTWTYTYDADGMRTGRTNGTDTYRYYYNGDQLVRMVRNNEVLDFTYAGGQPATMTYNGTTYYYLLNAQGDVVGLTNSEGTIVLGYTYGAYGTITGLMPDTTLAPALLEINPLTYRGYVYDRETKLFYLQSRYYDPVMGRFINADNYPTTGQGLTGNNMFAYCGNNPISREDSGGTWWHLAVGAIVGVVSQYVSDVVSALASGDSLSEALVPTSSAVDYLAAAASGALAASGVGTFGSAIANATIDGMAYVANCGINGEKVDGFEFLFTVTTSALSSGKGIDGANLRGVYQHSVDVLQTAISPKKIAMYTAKKVNVVKTVLTEIGSSLWGAVKDGLWDGAKQQLGW